MGSRGVTRHEAKAHGDVGVSGEGRGPGAAAGAAVEPAGGRGVWLPLEGMIAALLSRALPSIGSV